jgi:hypothetical protein
LDTIQIVEKIDVREPVYRTSSWLQVGHDFTARPDTPLAKQGIERDTRSGFKPDSVL